MKKITANKAEQGKHYYWYPNGVLAHARNNGLAGGAETEWYWALSDPEGVDPKDIISEDVAIAVDGE